MVAVVVAVVVAAVVILAAAIRPCWLFVRLISVEVTWRGGGRGGGSGYDSGGGYLGCHH